MRANGWETREVGARSRWPGMGLWLSACAAMTPGQTTVRDESAGWACSQSRYRPRRPPSGANEIFDRGAVGGPAPFNPSDASTIGNLDPDGLNCGVAPSL